MKNYSGMKKYSGGFTFVELMLGLTILAVVGVTALPRYMDAAQQAHDDALWEQSVAVKNAHDSAVNTVARQQGGMPSVATLVSVMPAGASAMAVASGVQVQVSGVSYVVPTYSNSLCTKPTKSVNDAVGCVGSISG